ALLPLPERPPSYRDLEKQSQLEASQQNQARRQQRREQGHESEQDMSEWETMDVIARLRLERHLNGVRELKWQNARWWRTLNRWMCVVGVAVVVVVIVLAVLGAKRNW